MSNLLALVVGVASNLEIKQIAILTISILPVLLLVRWAYDAYTSHINVPTVGVPPGILGPWRAPYRWMKESQHLIDEGMAKYGVHGKPFKIRMPTRWIVFMTNPTVLNEMKVLPANIMSFRKAADEAIRTEYTFHDGLMNDAWHLELIRKNLTEKLAKLLPEIVSEVTAAWGQNTSIGDEWVEINPWVLMLKVVSRTTNRALVGVPLCRNDEFLDSIIDFATHVVSTANKLDLVPSLVQPFAAKYLLSHWKDKTLEVVLRHIGPILEERRLQMKDQKWTTGNGPDDIFQWILESAPPGTTTRGLILSFLFIEFTAVHTSTITIVQVLFDLAANPQYQNPLRDEIENQLRDARGWTVQALAEMKKVDSVLRESARMNGTNIFTILRKVITSHTFSDGTYIPKGAWVTAPSVSIHHWDKIYKNPHIFDGFRFYEMRKAEGNATRFQNASTSIEYLPFGDGLSACPGRFFATNELKVMLANVVCNYEFKFAADVKRPGNFYEGVASFPDARVGILIRNRGDRKDSVFFSEKA